MKIMTKIFVILAGLIAILVMLLPACNLSNTGTALSTGANVGNLAPDFTLFDLSGQQVSLHSFLGRPVVVNFWATD
jgi:cytochrome oxidase Cu insertion factor (SCO1/SenC/PrrC family)